MAGRIHGQRRCGTRAHEPPCLGAAGQGLRARPQQEDRHAGGFGCEHEPALRRQIERFRLAPDLDDDSAECGTTRDLDARPQYRHRIAQLDQDEPRRIEAERRQPIGMQRAILPLGIILPDPDDRPILRRGPEHECGGETARCRIIGTGGGMDLVQRATGKPATQRRIDFALVEPDDPRGLAPLGFTRSLDRRHAPPQGSKGRLCRIHSHASLSQPTNCSRFVL